MFGLLLTGGLGYLLLPSDPKRAAGPVAGSVPHGGNASPSVSETPVIDITAASRRQAPTESNLTSPASLSMTGRAAILPLHPLPENTTTAPVAESSSGQSEEAGVQAAADSSGAIPADAVPSNTFKPTVVDSHSEEILTQAGSTEAAVPPPPGDPMTIESVINSFRTRNRNSKVDFQVYFTPTVSYRRLAENKAYFKTAQPGTPTNLQGLLNINNMVTHKPAFGFEVGFTTKYALNDRLKVRGGLQFNINRYDIKTFNSNFEMATIRLNNRDSLSAITSYNNVSGYKSNWLENFYFQVSAPIGVEYKLQGDNNVQFGIAGTLQPTFIIGDRAYLLSSDYKNYVEVPWLIRRWNMNTSFETFVSYSTGHLRWQVGPQVRYQLLSSFVEKYPVKENLFDFGLKVGISVNK